MDKSLRPKLNKTAAQAAVGKIRPFSKIAVTFEPAI